MPTEQILNEKQIAEIESLKPFQYKTMVALTVTQRDALCQTVRVLRAQLPAEMQNCTILFKQCAVGHGWLTATNWIQHGCERCEMETLQARLSEVEKERDRLREGERQGRGIIRGWQKHIERMAKILKCEAMDVPVQQTAQRLVNFRTRVINLCNQKAAEWGLLADAAPIGTLDKERLPLLHKRDAANELRQAIENLGIETTEKEPR